MPDTFIILIIITSVLVIAGIIGLIYYYNLRLNKLNLARNLPIVMNHLPKFTGSHAIFLEVSAQMMPNGMYYCVLQPIDIFVDDDGNISGAEQQELVIPPEHRLVYPKGTLSKERDIIEYIPRQASEIPMPMLKSALGEMRANTASFLKVIKDINLNNEAKDKAISNLVKQFSGGEMTSQQVNKLSDAYSRMPQQQMNYPFQRTGLPEQKEGEKR